MRFFLFLSFFSCVLLFQSCLHASPKKIAFLVHTETINGKGVKEFYTQMKKDGHEVKIVSIPLLTAGNKVLYDLDVDFTKRFDSKDVMFPCGTEKPYTKCTDLSDYRPDFVFVQNPYNSFKGSVLDEGYSLEGLRKIAKKVGYVVYGPHLFHQDHCNDTTLPGKLDYVFSDSESTKKIFVEKLKFQPENVIVSGFQNYKNVRDLMKNQENQPQEKKEYKETLLWLPRWTLHFDHRAGHEGGSTFLSYERFFYNFAKEHPETRLIVRPHVLLFSYGIDAKFFSKEDADEIMNKYKALKNVVLREHIKDPLEQDVLEADIVISDGTSALGEVVVANKPIVYLSNGWDNEFTSNDLAKELKEHIYFARDPLQLLTHLDAARQNAYAPKSRIAQSKKDSLRMRVLNKFFDDEYEKFKKKLDPVQNPSEFISSFVSHLNL